MTPARSRSTISVAFIADNYIALAEKAELSRDEMVTLAKNSFTASWLSEEDKAAYIAEIDEYVATFA